MAGKELRKSILNAEDISGEVIDVPEWGVKVEIRAMNGLERARFMRQVADPQSGDVSMEKFFPELLIATTYDPETGEKVFEAADRDAINTKSGSALQRLSEVAQRLSGLMTADVEEAEKNS